MEPLRVPGPGRRARRLPVLLALLALTVTPAPVRATAVPDDCRRPVAQPAAPTGMSGAVNRRIATSERVVALTFNAAWDDSGVPEVLGVLRRHKAPATFFMTGRFAERHPAAARAIAAEHGVASHSYRHPDFAGLTRQEACREVRRADRAIRRATGAVPLPFFRFPYSPVPPERLADVNALGFADVEYSADTNGYLGERGGMTVAKAVSRALDALGPGEIVQMHVGAGDGGPGLDAPALPLIIDTVRARGYRVVDLRALLKPPLPGRGPRTWPASGRR